MRATGLDGGTNQPIETEEVALRLHTSEQIIKHKVGLLNLAEELGNVFRACQVTGLSRDTFHRYKQAVEEGGIETLLHKDRRKPNTNNRVDENTEAAVVTYALDFPPHGQVRTNNELRKTGVFVSPSGVRSIQQGYQLACFEDPLRALEEKAAREGILLIGARVAALEKKKRDSEAADPGYLGSRDNFFVGTLEGVGRISNRLMLAAIVAELTWMGLLLT